MVYIFCTIALFVGLIIGFLVGKLSQNNDKLKLIQVQEQLKSKEETINSLRNMEELVKEQFTNIANKAIVDKQTLLTEQNNKILEPLSQSIDAFRKRIEDFSKEGSTNTEAIKTQINVLLNENKSIKNSANELSKTLKENAQARGEFGELILENLLKSAGLKNKNEYGDNGNYITQTGYRDLNNPTAPLVRPDAIIFFPDNKHIIVDSKLALNDFKEFANCEDESERETHLKNFFNQVEKMVTELGGKYNNLEGLHTPDFKLMFIPIEGILSYILNNQKLLTFANNNNVVIVGPSTLLATLKIINYSWTQKNQAENISQILKLSENIYAKCQIFIDRIEEIKKKFRILEQAFDEAMKPLAGKGGLASLVEKLTDYGLRPQKRISDNYLEEKIELAIINEDN